MAVQVIMPRMGQSMEEGRIVRWLHAPGDPVVRGEPLVEIETDKANVELDAAASGYLSAILVAEDTITPVGTTIALIEEQPVSYAAAGVEPRIMGMGPVAAVPKVLKQAGMKLQDIELIELNEAFASQSVAVMNELGINPEITNVNGGAIALGHPLGCTGTKLAVQLFDEMRRRGNKYGMVTMCVGGGMGAAGIFERLD